jgi:hypothetical protein
MITVIFFKDMSYSATALCLSPTTLGYRRQSDTSILSIKIAFNHKKKYINTINVRRIRLPMVAEGCRT